ncbi:MAG: hypothetical protein GAK30_03154 [Paracidovorax wautersii]|uniref:Lactonase, 7-bladed beta-propeller n=1 Tax=Paracidovorax wautersii TaxID=1177982 RepID=A0A7V8FLK3_9BURK|nr:MAG: hypothetical protein GAK30_03154 [Paracidovorax wautersii]
MFDVDPATGRLAWLGAIPSAGLTPRFFTHSPDARWLYVLNEDSHTIAQFDLADTRPLESWKPAAVTACGSPVCMVFSAPTPPAT